MHRIVIIGGGPIGLAAAKIFHDQGFKDITLIDDRLGQATRVGHLKDDNFTGVGKEVKATLTPSSSNHIKDIQRELERVNQSCEGIKMIRGSFITCNKNSVQFLDLETKETPILPYDLLCEASGGKRAVISCINTQESKDPPFKIESVADNPLKEHFIAYVQIENPLHREALDKRTASSDLLMQTLRLERLRLEFGWPEFAKPYIYPILLDKNKVCLYFETPPGLPAKKQESYIKTLLELDSGIEGFSFEYLKPSKKSHLRDKPKPRFIPFKVSPTIVTPAVYTPKDSAPIIVIGDAQHTGDYRFGFSIERSLQRFKTILSCMTTSKKTQLTIDSKKCAALLAPLHDEMKKDLCRLYDNIRTEFSNALEIEKQNYTAALHLTSSSEERVIIISGLQEIESRLALKDYQTILVGYQNILNSEQCLQLISNPLGTPTYKVKDEPTLLVYKKSLEDIVSNFPHMDDAKKTLRDMAINFKDIGAKLFATGNFRDSEKYFEGALKIYIKFFSHLSIEGVINLCSNVVVCANRNGNFDNAILHATLALNLLDKVENKDKEKRTGKITLNQASAILDKTLQEDLAGVRIDISKATKACEHVAKLLVVLNKNTFVNRKGLDNLKIKLRDCESKIGSLVPNRSKAPSLTLT